MPTKKKAVSMQINTKEKDPRGEERNVPANKQFDLDVPSTREELCDPVVESVAVSSPFMENNNSDKGSSHDIDLNKPPPPQTWMRESSERLDKENASIIHEPNAGLVFDLNTSTKQASNSYMSLTKDTRAPNTSPSKRKSCGTKLQENPTAKRRYARRKQVNKTSVPPMEVTGELTKEKTPASAQMSCPGSENFDERPRCQSYAVQKNQIVHPGCEIGVYQTAKRKHARRRGLNKTSAPPAEVTRELTEEKMPASAQVSCIGSVNFDERLRYRSYAVQKNPIVQPGSKIGVHRTAKREYVRRKGVNKTSAPPTKVTGELTEENMSDSAQVSCTRSVNFDERATGQSYAVKENISVHPGSEIVVVMQEMNVGLAFDLNTSMKQASNSYMSLPEDTLSPNIFPSRRKSSGIKLDENTTAKRKYVRRKGLNQTSAPPTEVTRESTKEMSGAAKMSCRRSLNFDIGTRDESSSGIENTTSLSGKVNGVLIQETNIGPAFDLNTSMKQASNCFTSLPKDARAANTYPSRRESFGTRAEENTTGIGKRKYVRWKKANKTSAPPIEVPNELNKQKMPARKEVRQTYHWEDDQTFNEFVLSLRRLAGRSQSSSCDHGSLTRIRDSNAEPNYTAKQIGVSGAETFGDAETPQTCIDALVAQTRVPLTKKRRNRKKRVLSSSEYPSTNGMLQHHNFTMRNYPMPMGKSSDIAPDVLWKTMRNIDALSEQFSQLNINTEARDTAFQRENILVPLMVQMTVA